jgi:Mg2+ and Co2+ transporter CorA
MNVPHIPRWDFWWVSGGLVASMIPLYFVARKWQWL